MKHDDIKNKSCNAYIYIPLLMKSIILLNKSVKIADHGESKLVTAKQLFSETAQATARPTFNDLVKKKIGYAQHIFAVQHLKKKDFRFTCISFRFQAQTIQVVIKMP